MIRKVIIISMVVVSVRTVPSSAMNVAGLEKQYSTFVANQQYKELSDWLAKMTGAERQKFFGSIIINQDTPLNMAMYDALLTGNTQLVEILLKAGANPDAVSAHGNTPFLQLMAVASEKGIGAKKRQQAFQDTVNLLLSYSQNPKELMRPQHRVLGQKVYPLESAIVGKFPAKMIWFLLDHNIDVIGTTSDGNDLFEFAKESDYPLDGIYQKWVQEHYVRPALTIEGAQDVGLPADIGQIINDYAPGKR